MEPEFVYVTYIATTPEQLWAALTVPESTLQYWGVELDSTWQQGSTVTWTLGDWTGADPEQTVLVADEPRSLSYTWHTITPEFGASVGGSDKEISAMAAEPRSVVSFDLEPAGDAVKLTVTQSGFGENSTILEGITQGWPMILSSLKTLLETGKPLAL